MKRIDPAAADQIRSLAPRPSFEALAALWEAAEADNTEKLARQLLVNAAALDQRKIDEQRGYWKGVRDVLGSPALAEKAWQRHVAKESESVE